jgi:hypothetical protein
MVSSGRVYAGLPSFLATPNIPESTAPARPVGFIPEPSGVIPNPVPNCDHPFCSNSKPFAFPAAISASEIKLSLLVSRAAPPPKPNATPAKPLPPPFI